MQIVLAATSLSSSHFSRGAGSSPTTCSCCPEYKFEYVTQDGAKQYYSRFAPHPSVTQVAPRWMKSSEEGRQMGRVKSEKTTGESILRMTKVYMLEHVYTCMY